MDDGMLLGTPFERESGRGGICFAHRGSTPERGSRRDANWVAGGGGFQKLGSESPLLLTVPPAGIGGSTAEL